MASSSSLSWLGGREIRACRQPGCGWVAAKAADVVLSSTISALHAGSSLRKVAARHDLLQLPMQGNFEDTSAEYVSGHPRQSRNL